MSEDRIAEQIDQLQKSYSTETSSEKKEKMYSDLLDEYEKAKARILELEAQLDEFRTKALPSKDEVETISSMIDLINKLDESTIDKLNKFGKKS